jgi:hypothetical protein
MQDQSVTFEQKVNVLQHVTLFPALTVMVFLRRKIGYRFLDPLKIQIAVLFLWVYGAFSMFLFGPVGSAVYVFSFVVLIAAIIERRIRWREVKRGMRWHTYSRGISWCTSFLPFSETFVKRFVDPAVILFSAIVLYFFLRPLSFYLLLSAVCLFLFETIDFQKGVGRMLDQLDRVVESEVIAENAEYYAQGGGLKGRSLEETAGISTGTDPDLARAIEQRKARQGQATRKTVLSDKSIVKDEVARGQRVETTIDLPEAADSDLAAALKKRRSRKEGTDLTGGTLFPLQPPSTSSPVQISQAYDARDQAISIESSSSRQTMPLDGIAIQPQVIGQQQDIPVVKSIDDPVLRALPSGAPFMTPDGKMRWKK